LSFLYASLADAANRGDVDAVAQLAPETTEGLDFVYSRDSNFQMKTAFFRMLPTLVAGSLCITGCAEKKTDERAEALEQQADDLKKRVNVLKKRVKVLEGERSAKAKSEAPEPGQVVALAPFVLNVKSKGDELHAMKAVLALELRKGDAPESIQGFVPRIRDAFIEFLRGLSYETISDAKSLNSMTKGLLDSAHRVGATGVSQVLVQDLVIQ